jgi:hypothetical protein
MTSKGITMLRSIHKILSASLLITLPLLTGCTSGEGNPESADSASKLKYAAATTGNWQTVNRPDPTKPANPPALIPAFSNDHISLKGFTLNPKVTSTAGFALQRLMNGTWKTIPGWLVDIALDRNSTLWGVNKAGSIFYNQTPFNAAGGTWVEISHSANASHIAAGASGDVYYVSKEPFGNGFNVYKFLDLAGNIVQMPDGMVDVSVDNNGKLWGIDHFGQVFHYDGVDRDGKWTLVTYPYAAGAAVDIAVGGGMVYILGAVAANGGNTIANWDGTKWTVITGGLTHIQVDDTGRLWGTNNADYLFYYTPLP